MNAAESLTREAAANVARRLPEAVEAAESLHRRNYCPNCHYPENRGLFAAALRSYTRARLELRRLGRRPVYSRVEGPGYNHWLRLEASSKDIMNMYSPCSVCRHLHNPTHRKR